MDSGRSQESGRLGIILFDGLWKMDCFVFINVDLIMWLRRMHGNIRFAGFGSATAGRSPKRLSSGSVKVLIVVRAYSVRAILFSSHLAL